MSVMPSLPAQANLSDVITAFPKGWPEMLEFHDAVLRSAGALSIAERELIAAYVSGLNRCRFCYNAHTVYAEAFGIAPETIEVLLSDVDAAPIDAKLRPILVYARVLTLDPPSVRRAHVDAILAAGWPEEAVAETCKVVALFNFMNRIVSGMGVDAFDEHYAQRRTSVRETPLEARRAANASRIDDGSYLAYGRSLGIMD